MYVSGFITQTKPNKKQKSLEPNQTSLSPESGALSPESGARLYKISSKDPQNITRKTRQAFTWNL